MDEGDRGGRTVYKELGAIKQKDAKFWPNELYF